MTHAFKCDRCTIYFDGHSESAKDLRVGDTFMLRVLFARLEEKKDKEPDIARVEEVTGLNIEKIPDGLAAMMGLRTSRIEEVDGKEMHAADLCPECKASVLEAALIRVQTEGVLSLLNVDLPLEEE